MPALAAARARRKGVGNLGGRLHHDAFRSEARCDLMVGGAGEHSADVVMKHFHLLAGDLSPGSVVADYGNHRDAVAHEGVEFG